MNRLHWCAGALALLAVASRSAALPNDDPLALRGPEMGVGVSLDAQGWPLERIFAALGERSGATFALDPEVASMRANLSVEHVPVRSILSLLAENLRLVYVARGERIEVRLPSADDPRAPNYTFAFDTKVGERSQRWPRIGGRVGLCGILSHDLREVTVYSLHRQVPAIEERAGGDRLTLTWCIEGQSKGLVSFLADVTLVTVSAAGYAEQTRRTLVRKDVPIGGAATPLFVSGDGQVVVSVDGLAAQAVRPGGR